MFTDFSAADPARFAATNYPLPGSSEADKSAPSESDRGTEDEPLTHGWYDSSFDLRRGLEVIEWVLPDFASPGKP